MKTIYDHFQRVPIQYFSGFVRGHMFSGDVPKSGTEPRKELPEELLFFAAQLGDIQEITRLLDLGTSIHLRASDLPATPKVWVAGSDMPLLAQTTSLPDATALLLSRGADPLGTLSWCIDAGKFPDTTLVEYLIDDYIDHCEEVEPYAATLTLLLDAGASHEVRNLDVPDELRKVLDRYACLRQQRQLQADTAAVSAARATARRL